MNKRQRKKAAKKAAARAAAAAATALRVRRSMFKMVTGAALTWAEFDEIKALTFPNP